MRASIFAREIRGTDEKRTKGEPGGCGRGRNFTRHRITCLRNICMIYFRYAGSRDPISFMQSGHYCPAARPCPINKPAAAGHEEIGPCWVCMTEESRLRVYFHGSRVMSKDALTWYTEISREIALYMLANVAESRSGDVDFFVATAIPQNPITPLPPSSYVYINEQAPVGAVSIRAWVNERACCKTKLPIFCIVEFLA